MIEDMINTFDASSSIRGWIDVRDQLPEPKWPNTEVLMCNRAGFVYVGYHEDGDDWRHLNHVEAGNVIAWMPMPDPVKIDELNIGGEFIKSINYDNTTQSLDKVNASCSVLWEATPTLQRPDWEPLLPGGYVNMGYHKIHGITCNDAKLIAAAPIMLSALLHVAESWGGQLPHEDCGCDDCDYLRPIINAINASSI